MAVNKVVYGDNVLIDLSSDTNSADKMLAGTTSHDKAGNPITGTIESQAAQTITPGTADQSISAGKYLAGKQTIKGDANLLPANIKKGVSIFGVAGSMEAGSGGGSGGGGALDTCTIKVWQGTGITPMFAYTGVTTVDESGNIGAKPYNADDSYETNNGGWAVYNNVLCGSAIVVCDIDWMGDQSCSVTGGVELLHEAGYGFSFRAPTEAGSVGTIKLNV